MKHILKDGVEMYFEIQGKKDSETTIVFLNGLSQSTLSWVAIAPAFYENHRVVLLDFVFQGLSGTAEKFRSYDEHAADVFHLLTSSPGPFSGGEGEKKRRDDSSSGGEGEKKRRDDSSSGGEGEKKGKIFLCGISYGSAVAQHLVVNYPDFFSGAILLSTFGHNTHHFNVIGESWINALLAGGYPLMLDVMLPTVLGKSYFEKPLIPIQTLKESRIGRDLATESLLKLMEATNRRGDYREKLKNVKVPVIVVQGEEDFLIPPAIAKDVTDGISGAEFLVIEKVGHTLNLEAIPQVIQVLKRFLVSSF